MLKSCVLLTINFTLFAYLSSGQSFGCIAVTTPCFQIETTGESGLCLVVLETTCTNYIPANASSCQCTAGSESPLIQTSPGGVSDTVSCEVVTRDTIKLESCSAQLIVLDNDVNPTALGLSIISASQQKEYVFNVTQTVKIGKIRLRMLGYDSFANTQNIIGLYSKPDTAVKTVFNGPNLLTFFGNPIPAPTTGGPAQFEFTPLNQVTFGPGQFSIFVTNGGDSDFNWIFENGNPAPVSNSSIAATVSYFFYDSNNVPDYDSSSLFNSITFFMTV